jgi:hypothetical protein
MMSSLVGHEYRILDTRSDHKSEDDRGGYVGCYQGELTFNV